MSHRACIALMFLLSSGLHAQNQSQAAQEQTDSPSNKPGFTRAVFNLLNMAGTEKSNQFHALTQPQRNGRYFRTMINPLGFVKCAFSAGIDQANNKPSEWQQGASAYGERYANILGQYSIQRTVTYGLESALHEDNRYFNSGKEGIWPRTAYALSSGILARHDDGTRHFSISQAGGVAAGAFLARTWLPSSQSSAADGAVSFGITMTSNIGFAVAKEFLPDLVRTITKKHNKPQPDDAQPRRSSTNPRPYSDVVSCSLQFCD